MSKVSFSKTKGLSALGLLTYFFLFLSVALSFSLSNLLRDTGVGEVTQTPPTSQLGFFQVPSDSLLSAIQLLCDF